MTLVEAFGLGVSAMAAGAINAVAGGGTLITFPALLFFGTPPVIANATSTLALVLGTGGSVYGYRNHLPAIRSWFVRFVWVSMVGSLIGGVLLTRTSNQTFSKLVPFLILFATVLFLFQGLFKRFAFSRDRSNPRGVLPSHAPSDADREIFSSAPQSGNPSVPKPPSIGTALLFQFLVAVYGGYFGAGIGILMLASFGFLGLANIHEMNALKTILSSLINLVASAWFIAAGLIHWPEAAVMTAGALAGYYIGAHYSQRIPQIRVRQIITAIGLLLSAVTFYEEFLS
jgi:uncharacterized membrane protein YfcA